MADRPLARKRAVVISDDSRMIKPTRLVLLSMPGMQVEEFLPSSPARPNKVFAFGSPDLIILIQTSPKSDPLVMLAQASLGHQIGQVPIVILSNEQLRSDPDSRIFYLGYNIAELRAKVQEVLCP